MPVAIAELPELPVKVEAVADSDGSVDDTWVCCDKCEAWHVLPPGQCAPKDDEQWFCRQLGEGFDCGLKPSKKKRETTPTAAPAKAELPLALAGGENFPPSKRAKKTLAVQRGGIGAPARAKYGEVTSGGVGVRNGPRRHGRSDAPRLGRWMTRR